MTAGLGVDDLVGRFEADLDDYSAIMVKALADRLAEAFAEYLHAQARRDWGYGQDEHLSAEDLAAEKFRGIRPAFGYPACPDHTEKGKLFALLDAGRQGITLTESFAMMPAASVSGLYLASPDARYFMVGRIGADQVEGLRGAQGDAARGSRTLARAKPLVRCPGGVADLLMVIAPMTDYAERSSADYADSRRFLAGGGTRRLPSAVVPTGGRGSSRVGWKRSVEE